MPLALTPKSICGSDAAQSCDGCAAVWITSSRGLCSARRSHARRVADVDVLERKVSKRRAAPWVVCEVDAPARKTCPHVVLDADDVIAGLSEVPEGIRTDESAGACDNGDWHD